MRWQFKQFLLTKETNGERKKKHNDKHQIVGYFRWGEQGELNWNSDTWVKQYLVMIANFIIVHTSPASKAFELVFVWFGIINRGESKSFNWLCWSIQVKMVVTAHNEPDYCYICIFYQLHRCHSHNHLHHHKAHNVRCIVFSHRGNRIRRDYIVKV